MTILVTGATGGVGRLLIDRLKIHKKETVISIGRSDKTHKNYIRCDIREAEVFRNTIVSIKPRILYHLAASFTDCYNTDYSINVSSTQQILETLRIHKMKTRLVLIGSAAEYGFVSSDDNPVRETHPLCPISIYGLTKAFQTQYALYHTHRFGSDVVIARLFNLFAPGLSERLFIGHLEKQIQSYLRKEITKIEVGNLNSYRDYVEANEAIYQLMTIAEKGCTGEVYHIASGKPRLMRDILKRFLEEFNLDFSVIKEGCPIPEKLKNDVPLIYADTHKISALCALHKQKKRAFTER